MIRSSFSANWISGEPCRYDLSRMEPLISWFSMSGCSAPDESKVIVTRSSTSRNTSFWPLAVPTPTGFRTADASTDVLLFKFSPASPSLAVMKSIGLSATIAGVLKIYTFTCSVAVACG